MGQSRISSHLALLRQGEIVVDRKEGKRTYYSLNDNLIDLQKKLIASACESMAGVKEMREDQINLRRVLEKRRKATERYFNEIAGRLGKKYCPGRSWEAIGHFLLHLTPHIDIADLGAGEGMIAQLLARRAKKVICIDNSPRMCEVGTRLAVKNGFNNLQYKLGDIEQVPLKNSSVDLALLSHALHHAEHPPQALNESYRILRPGGQVIIIDLKEHNFEKAHDLYADRWLGFKENTLYQYLKKVGFKQVEVNVITQEKEEPYFETILGSGLKPARS